MDKPNTHYAYHVGYLMLIVEEKVDSKGTIDTTVQLTVAKVYHVR